MNTSQGVITELSFFIKIGKEDGSVYLEKFEKFLSLLHEPEEGDTFDYKKMTLDVLPNFLQLLPKITIQRTEVGEMVLNVICHLMSVMAVKDTENSIPFLLHLCASCLMYMPSEEAHHKIVSKLCEYILPMTILYARSQQEDPLSFLPIPTVLHTVLDCCEKDLLHVQVADTLMWLKRDVCSDMLTVIAMGTKKVRLRAVKLLCRYWLGGLWDDGTPTRSTEWVPPACGRCQGDGCAAALVCLDAQCAAKHSSKQNETPLYLYLCKSCDKKVHDEHSKHLTVPYPQPLRDFKVNCEFQRSCQGPGAINQAVVTCYHTSCTTIQRGQPLRMCQACHVINHEGLQDDRHIYQVGPVNPWEVGVRRNQLNDVFSAKALLEALSKLLECRPEVTSAVQAEQSKGTITLPSYHFSYSREAVFLLTNYCTPKAHVSEGRQYWLTRFVAHTLEWLLAVYKMVEAHAADGVSFLEHLTGHRLWTDITEHLVPWLQVVHSLHPRMLVDCLVPNRTPAAQVQDYPNEGEECRHALWKLYTLNWSYLAVFKEPSQYHELFCTVMTGWMSTLCFPNNRGKWEGLEEVFCAIFNSREVHDELFPLYYFVKRKISERDGIPSALAWLQELTCAGVVIPYLHHFFERIISEEEEGNMSPHLLVSGVGGGFDSPDNALSEYSPLSRFILMLDLVLAQLQLSPKAASELHRVHQTLDYDSLVSIMLSMLSAQGVWEGRHTGDHHDSSNPCPLCQGHSLWFKLASQVVQSYQALLRESLPVSVSDEQSIAYHSQASETSGPFTLKKSKPQQDSTSASVNIPKSSRASSSATSVGSGVTFSLPDESPQGLSQGGMPGRLDAIIESQCLESPPPEDQYHALHRQSSVYDSTTTYKLFQKAIQMLRLKGKNRLHPSAIYHMVDFLDTFVLRVGILEAKEAPHQTMFSDIRGLFFKLWDGLQSDNGFLSQKILPLFMRTIRFLSPNFSSDHLGTSISKALELFWSKLDEESFQSSDWKVRFHSAEKVMLLAHFTTAHLSIVEELFLGYCFCNLIGLMMDSKMEVSVRARYCIENTGREGLKLMVSCCVKIFNHMSTQQSRVLKALSSLHASYPQLGVVTYEDVIEKFHIYQRLWGEYTKGPVKQKLSKQGSDGAKEGAGTGKGVTMRQLKDDINVIRENSESLTQVITLLLQVLTNPATCHSIADVESEVAASDLARKFELILCHGPEFVVKVNELRESQLLELFLFQMYQVLDSNTVFSQNINLLSFLLRLLVFVVLPREEDFRSLADMTVNPHTLHVGLELLDDTVCQNWLDLFFIICYKYGGVVQSSDYVDTLLPWVMACLEIVLNTIHMHAHECFPGEVPKEPLDEVLVDSMYSSANEEKLSGRKTLPKQTSFGGLGLSMEAGRSQRKGRLLSHGDTNAVTQKAVEEAFVLRCKSFALQRKPIIENETCPLCHKPKQVYPEKSITLCVVAMGTFANRFPTRVARYLKNVTMAMAKVIIPGSYPWQDLKLAGSKPGSAISVAKQFLVCILSQFGERNLFQHLFGWSLSDDGASLLPAIVSSLPASEPEGEDQDARTKAEPTITQVTPVELFLKDCLASSNLQSVLTEIALVNLARYLSLLRDTSAKRDLLKVIPLLDHLLKRLTKPNLQDFLTRDKVWVSVVQVMVLFIQAFKDTRVEKMRTKVPEPSEEEKASSAVLLCLSPHITEILEQGLLRCGKVTLFSILSLLAGWYEAFSVEQKPNKEQEKFLRLFTTYHLPLALRVNSQYHRNSRLALIQFALLAQGGLYGYLEDFSGQRLHTRELRLNDQFHLCFEKFCQLPVNLEVGFQLLSSLEVKDPVLQLSVAELLLLNFDSYSTHSTLQRLRNLIRFPDRSTGEATTAKGSTPASSILGHVQVLASLTWLILASMRGWAVSEATNSDPLTTSEGVQHHTSTIVIHLMEHVSPEYFVEQVAVVVREAISRLAVHGTEEEIKTVFVFIEVWMVYLELIQNKLVIDIVSYVMEDFWQRITDEVDKVPEDSAIAYHFHKCISFLKQANVTTLPALVPVIAIGRCRLEDKDSADTLLGEAKAIGSLDEWMKSILTALCGQG